MLDFRTLAVTAIATGAIVGAAVPAAGAVTTFAQFQSIGTRGQTYWKNNGSNGSNNGTGGSLYTTNTSTSTAPGSQLVSFSFLQDSISPYVTNVVASYTLFASVSNAPAVLASGQLIEQGLSGGFSFLTTASLTVGSNVYAAGSNLLSGTFTTSTISGGRGGSSAGFGTSGAQNVTLTYTSDFLSFFPTSNNDFSFSLTSLSPALQAAPSGGTPNKALRTFRAFQTGSFSSDPVPTVTAVPEPAMWGLMIIGFGMVGLQSRRQKSAASVIV